MIVKATDKKAVFQQTTRSHVRNKSLSSNSAGVALKTRPT